MPKKPISETIGFLLAQTCKAHRNLADRMLAEVGLHAGQDMILLRLWPEDGLIQADLADHLCVQAATVTKMIHRLVEAGFVERRGDPEDQRISRIYLTEKGRALQQPVEEIWERFEQCSFAALTLEERILLRRLLMQVVDNLSKSP